MTLVRMNQSCGNQLSRTENASSRLNSWLKEFDNGYNVHNQANANIIEGEKAFEIQMAVPGYSKKDIQIKVENGLLTVSNESPESVKDQDLRYVRREFSLEGFKRSFRLSRWTDHESISARFENGILRINIPKKEEAITKPSREIKIS